jgi:hypothetical protein
MTHVATSVKNLLGDRGVDLIVDALLSAEREHKARAVGFAANYAFPKEEWIPHTKNYLKYAADELATSLECDALVQRLMGLGT